MVVSGFFTSELGSLHLHLRWRKVRTLFPVCVYGGSTLSLNCLSRYPSHTLCATIKKRLIYSKEVRHTGKVTIITFVSTTLVPLPCNKHRFGDQEILLGSH